MVFSYFSRNGLILPIDQAVIPLLNIEYSYGFGVYETLKIRNGVLYFEEMHINRLLASAKVINLEHTFTKIQITSYISDLLKKIPTESYNVKILLIGAKLREDALLFVLPLSPLFPDKKIYFQGVKTISVQYERLFPQAKTLNMLPSYLAYKTAKEQYSYDSLLINKRGIILEGTRTNFFTLKDMTIFMPNKEFILDGVTSQTVLYVARKNGFIIQEWDIAIKELKDYDGAFFTSTSSKIVPIKQVDDYVFEKIPEKLKLLMVLYDKFLIDSKGIFSGDITA